MEIKLVALSLNVLILFGISKQEDNIQKHWALLVAGSNEYYNYRHQADICHAYHVVRNHGIPPERIVVMMYDDIAYNSENPVQGNIINEPNGPNVYTGVQKDYTGEEVTPDIFLKVLTGDSEGIEKSLGRKGKVIKSGPNDRVFVNFADHGGPGILLFPHQKPLFADDLDKALVKMYENGQFKQLVFYVEACNSGSMFNNLLRDDINVFATTAANPDESSFACYFDVKRQTYLGDVYSVNWMEDSDVDDLKKETLQKQFKLVKKETNTSHVMEYGEKSLSKLSVGDFQGNLSDNSLRFRRHQKVDPNIDAIPSEDVAFEILRRRNDLEALEKLIVQRDSTRKFFEDVVLSVSNLDYWTLYEIPIDFSDFTCYKKSIAEIKKMCSGMKLFQNDYALGSLKVLANLCETDTDVEKILNAIWYIAKISPLCASE